MEIVDARGLSCPEPVMLTMEALKNNNAEIKVLVSSANARDNIIRQCERKDKKISVSEIDSYYEIIIK